MQSIAESDIKARIQRDNPWWVDAASRIPEAEYPRRVYFALFRSLALNFEVRRATVLLGPRRVGKTVMIKQLIHDAIESGIDAQGILYASIDAPIYSGIALETFLRLMPNPDPKPPQRLVIFDEIQYLMDWEVHMKDLVDNFPDVKFIATGSAAASLRLKSRESGAGRFTEFMLPPLTFYEFLEFVGEHDKLITAEEGSFKYRTTDIEALNTCFVDYLNFGGYPEAVLNPEVRRNPEQFIRNDIIDKVLLKDLPSLYGIHEIQQLNRLFSFLAYNSGNEASLENISRESGLTKPTITRYIEYLESAFLILKLPTVDDNCRTMKRERNFKVYLNNPSMRAALFAPVSADDSSRIGHLAESAIFSQWQHSNNFRLLRYARWRNGEVDIVFLREPDNRPLWVGEIKWSDRVASNPTEEMKAIQTLLKRHQSIVQTFMTTQTIRKSSQLEGRTVEIYPSALYCYMVGRNIASRLNQAPSVSLSEKE
jgi:predicted AAA+ superfamily ATPase